MSKLYRNIREYAKDGLLAAIIVVAWFSLSTLVIAALGAAGVEMEGITLKAAILFSLGAAISAGLRHVRATAYDDGLDARRNEFDEIPF